MTRKIAAGSSAGRLRQSERAASTPPAEPPMTTTSRPGMKTAHLFGSEAPERSPVSGLVFDPRSPSPGGQGQLRSGPWHRHCKTQDPDGERALLALGARTQVTLFREVSLNSPTSRLSREARVHPNRPESGREQLAAA